MKLYPLAFTAALLPLFAIHLCYIIAASYGHVPWCIPYWDSCSSISAAGRFPPEFFIFKALMIPSAVILFLYWWCCERWLTSLNPEAKRHPILLGLALIASLGLILYSVMLGAIGDIYQLQRRIGVTTFFGLSYIAQLLVNYRLSQYNAFNQQQQRLRKTLTYLSLLVLLIGLASIVWNAVDEDYYDSKEDAFEWTLTVLLCLHVLQVGRLWKRSEFTLQFAARS